MIRDAKFGDCPSIHALIREGYERSKYAGKVEINERLMKSFVTTAISRQGQKGPGGALVKVAVGKSGATEGFLIGVLQPVYQIGDMLTVTDAMLYVTPDSDARHFPGLVKALDAWAKENPKVYDCEPTISNLILSDEDRERAAKLYERLGYRRSGAMFSRRIQR
ncbi:MAG: hypothetical protein VW405_04790 [Rhodospirillaceae bacterium]